MASVAVFVCYMCEHVFTLSPKHFCQPECDTLTAFHRDFCPGCKRMMNADAEVQVANPDADADRSK
jgi:hypothetical protein